MDIAIAGAGSWIRLDQNDTIAEARIALASVAPIPMRANKAEQCLIGRPPGRELFAEAGRLAARECAPISDTRGSADYRRELVATLTRRTLSACAANLNIDVEAS